MFPLSDRRLECLTLTSVTYVAKLLLGRDLDRETVFRHIFSVARQRFDQRNGKQNDPSQLVTLPKRGLSKSIAC